MPSLRQFLPLWSKEQGVSDPRLPRSRSRRSAAGDGAVSEPYEWRGLLRSATDTEQLGRFIGQSLLGGEVLALHGELGTGKTTLVRGIAIGLGVPAHIVNSPTFVLIHEYQGRVPFAHADLYRIQAAPELQHIGLSDYLDGQTTVVAIEWADKCVFELPDDRLEVYLSHRSARTRQVVLRARGTAMRGLLVRVLQQRGALKATNIPQQARPIR